MNRNLRKLFHPLMIVAVIMTLVFPVAMFGAELVTAEVTETTNDVTVTQGGASQSSNISVSATGSISNLITSSNASTAQVKTNYTFTGGSLSSSTFSSALKFFAANTGCSGNNCDVTWTDIDPAPGLQPYIVSASISADAATPAGNYPIQLSPSAGTIQVANPDVSGGKLGDTNATNITVRVRLAAPSNLAAAAPSQSQINLSWNDNSTGESGFLIQSRASESDSWANLATVGEGVTSYQHTGLSCGTTRYYRLIATHSTTALNSDYSSSANATTSACSPPPPSDSTPPAISYILNPASPDGANGWYKSNVTLTWTVTENESPSSLIKTGCVDQNITSDQQATTYSCSATSDGGSAGPVSVTIKRDASAPTNVTGAPNRAADHNGWYNQAVTVEFKGEDATSGIASCTSTSYSGPDSATASVNGSCTDTAGNTSASVASSSFKYDATKPALSPSVSPNPVLLNGNATASANATDATSGIASSSCGDVDTSSVGSKSVSCSATDNAGNNASANASYSVSYNFIGFSSPVDNNNVLNRAKAGQAIPLKWRLLDANNNPVTNLSSAPVTVTSLSCTLGTTIDQLEEYAAGASGLQNLGDGYYQINWKSPTTYANSCKTMNLNLGEGAMRTALFQFVK